MKFARKVCGSDPAMLGIAAFAMEQDFDYLPDWHRDSYAAWGKDSPEELRVRHMKKMPATQVLLALEDDASFWFVPGSHNRANTALEEARFEEGRTGWQESFEGAIQVEVAAGSAVPFDARGIHRGLKRSGVRRRSLFVVYGTAFDNQRMGAGSIICGANRSRIAARQFSPRGGTDDRGGAL